MKDERMVMPDSSAKQMTGIKKNRNDMVKARNRYFLILCIYAA